jgi:hypothetical protein
MIEKIYSGIQGDYVISYCDLCKCDIISCLDPKCSGASCNGMGCSKCHQDFIDFHQFEKNLRDNGQTTIN